MSTQRIMIVEDETIVALDIKGRLNMLGYEVVAQATNGQDALRAASEHSPDLILMDIMIDGDMDGIATAEAIQEKQFVPVVYLTAYADDDTLARAKTTGPFGYIIKPFEDRELKLTIEMALYKHRMEQRLYESERWMASTLGSISDAVLSADKNGKVLYINPAAERLLGWSIEEARGKDVSEVFKVLDLDTGVTLSHPVDGVTMRTVPDGSQREMLLVTARGEEVPVTGSISPIINDQGSTAGVVVVYHDSSAEKRAEARLKKSMIKLRRTLTETVGALSEMAEKRDPYTAGHQRRVARLACAIARKLDMDDDAVEGLRIAALLHDIGKIYIPTEILSKPAMLSRQEMGLMRNHPTVGHDILHNISFPWPVARTVLQHHERLDGTGYPHGLSGGDICREARILAVADVVEAMNSHRPYRPALGTKLALSEIREQRGIYYDPVVVDACLELMEENVFTFDPSKED